MPEIILKRSENLIELYASRKELAKELKKRTEDLQSSKRYDSLTGLPNMQQFLAIAQEIVQGDGNSEAVEYRFIYTNITNFRFYNVRYGMSSGDQFLRMVAEQIQGVFSDVLCARYGLDHILIMTKDDTDAILDRIRKIADEFAASFGRLGMQFKAGIYCLQSSTEKVEAACEFAKIACDSIRDSNEYYCEYTKSLRHRIELNTYVMQHLDEAIENHYIQVYFQPVIRTVSGLTTGMEALARWIDPKMGLLSPADFIQVLEENRLITKLDLHMLREICRCLKEMRDQNRTIVPIALNLSRVDFMEKDIFEKVNAITAEYGIPHDMINIEVTETAVMMDPEKMDRELQRFRNNGYQVWMDDFGSGYSSLNVLKDHQFDEIKLDMKFMDSFDEKSKEIVKMTVCMAKKLGIQTLAEGVETQEQFDFLRDIGCEKVQGYLFSRPFSRAELESSALTAPERMEFQSWRQYYDRLSASNFVTERTLALIEYNGEQFQFLYANKAYRDVLSGTGSPNMQNAEEIINSPSSPLNRLFCDLRDRCHMDEGAQEIVYSIRDHLVRIRVCCIAEYKNRTAFEVEITDLTFDRDAKMRTEMERVGWQLFGMYDVIFHGDLDTQQAVMMRQGNYGYGIQSEKLHSANSILEVLEIAAQQIHPDDRDDFLRFSDPHTLKERMDQAKRSYITDYFRTRVRGGEYVWKMHKILYRQDFGTVVYCTSHAYFDEDRIREKMQK